MPRKKLGAIPTDLLSREHAGWLDYLKEMEPYARENPDDDRTAGQVRYALKRVKLLEEKLGLAANRK